MIDEYGIVKLIDWELCSFNRFSNRRVGTLEYMAEEVHRAELYECIKADIWSLAVVMFCLATGKRPYEQFESEGVSDEWIQTIYNENWRRFWRSHQVHKKFPRLPVEFKYCLETMLKQEPDERASIENIMTASFFLGDELEPKDVVDMLELCPVDNPLF